MSRLVPRILRELAEMNDGVTVESGTRHWQVRKDGKLVCVYPGRPAREGFAENTKSQLRQAGIRYPGQQKQRKEVMA